MPSNDKMSHGYLIIKGNVSFKGTNFVTTY